MENITNHQALITLPFTHSFTPEKDKNRKYNQRHMENGKSEKKKKKEIPQPENTSKEEHFVTMITTTGSSVLIWESYQKKVLFVLPSQM